MKIFLTFAFILIAFTANCQNSKYTLGQTASLLEYGKYKAVSDPFVIEAAKLLKSLSAKYNDTEYNILDWTQRTQSTLKQSGVHQSLISLMKVIDKTKRIQNTPYKDMIALYGYMLIKEQ